LKDLIEIKISIAIPVYNEEGVLRNFLDRLLTQTKKPEEIIFCDGGSSDSTLSILKEYQNTNSSIKTVKRKGQCRGAGRNSAIESSESDFVALIDVGNLPEIKWLELLVEEINLNREIEVIYGAVYPEQSDAITKCFSSFILGRTKHNQMIERSVASMVIKKEIWKKVGKFPESKDGSYVVEDLRFLDKLDEENFQTANKQSAFTRWSVPKNYKDIYKRFYNLTLGANRSGYSKMLVGGIIRNYSLCFIIFVLAAFVNFYLLTLIPALLLYRVYVYHKFNIWFKKVNFFEKSYLLVTGFFVFSVIDAATLSSYIFSIFSHE
jgi:glycosyltransferase involved in cell wall biosynthesis